MMRLKNITLVREKVADWTQYPFNVSAIRNLHELQIHARVIFFVGENGSGKSTLLEAIADNYGFAREGGSRNFHGESTETVRAIEPLTKALRVGFSRRTGQGFYLRAESFFNVATRVDEMAHDLLDGHNAYNAYGGKSLHVRSHGESFFALFENRFSRRGFYVLDEPEAALSPQRQLSFLARLHSLLEGNDEIQFLIATHSPMLLAYPGAQIFSFDDEVIHEISYQETSPYQIVSRFLEWPDVYLRELFSELPLENEDMAN